MQRQYRLRDSERFAQIRELGQQWNHALVGITVAKNGLSHNRYGLITSRRLGGAVVRNRVRRQMREVVRLAHPRLISGVDVVLAARTSIVGKPYPAVRAAIEELFRRARLWRPMPDHPTSREESA